MRCGCPPPRRGSRDPSPPLPGPQPRPRPSPCAREAPDVGRRVRAPPAASVCFRGGRFPTRTDTDALDAAGSRAPSGGVPAPSLLPTPTHPQLLCGPGSPTEWAHSHFQPHGARAEEGAARGSCPSASRRSFKPLQGRPKQPSLQTQSEPATPRATLPYPAVKAADFPPRCYGTYPGGKEEQTQTCAHPRALSQRATPTFV